MLFPNLLRAYKEIIKEVSQREKQAGIVPDPDVDAYMKVSVQLSILFSVLELIKVLFHFDIRLAHRIQITFIYDA